MHIYNGSFPAILNVLHFFFLFQVYVNVSPNKKLTFCLFKIRIKKSPLPPATKSIEKKTTTKFKKEKQKIEEIGRTPEEESESNSNKHRINLWCDNLAIN